MYRVLGLTIVAACLLGSTLLACSGSSDGNSDTDAGGTCWTGGGTPSPGAEVELGKGLSEFEPIEPESDLQLTPGLQGASHFFVHARIRGLSPGVPRGPIADNPNTRFKVYRENGEDITIEQCSLPLPYLPAAEGLYQLEYGRTLQIGNSRVPEIYGERLRITVEVRDAQGRYAMDERWITVVPLELPDAGLPDAAPADAAPADAAAPDAGLPDAAPADASLVSPAR